MQIAVVVVPPTVLSGSSDVITKGSLSKPGSTPTHTHTNIHTPALQPNQPSQQCFQWHAGSVTTIPKGEHQLLSLHQLTPPHSFAFLLGMQSQSCLVSWCSVWYILRVLKRSVPSPTCFFLQCFSIHLPSLLMFYFAQQSCFFLSATWPPYFVLSHSSDMRSDEHFPSPYLPAPFCFPCRLLQTHFG